MELPQNPNKKTKNWRGEKGVKKLIKKKNELKDASETQGGPPVLTPKLAPWHRGKKKRTRR